MSPGRLGGVLLQRTLVFGSIVDLHYCPVLTMSTAGSKAGLDLFEKLEIEYENAYGHNEFKKAAVQEIINLIPPGSRVLDVGCGTGRPVTEMLADAGLHVVACDISPKMLEIASSRVPNGTFVMSDMLEYQPEGDFSAVLVIFSHLQLSTYADFHAAMYRFASALLPNGVLAIGTQPSDIYVKEKSSYDETRTYAENYPAPFMGEDLPTFFLTAKGMEDFITSTGLEIVSQERGMFEPKF